MPQPDQIRSYSGETTCLRCGQWATKHKVASVAPDGETSNAVEGMLRGRRTKAIKQHSLSDLNTGMLGALHAVTRTGRHIHIIAVSGNRETDRLDHWRPESKWIVADVDVPDKTDNWIDIYGREFKLPTSVRNTADISRACAAIKLLRKLGQIYKEKNITGGYSALALYEEDMLADGDGDPGEAQRQKSIKRYRGGETQYGAVSCNTCKIRLPLLLCDSPIN